jgi:hypothetical protein
VTLPAKVLLDAIAGRTSFAALIVSGKLRVEGEPSASLAIGGMVEAFRTQVKQATGAQGAAVRALARWVAA